MKYIKLFLQSAFHVEHLWLSLSGLLPYDELEAWLPRHRLHEAPGQPGGPWIQQSEVVPRFKLNLIETPAPAVLKLDAFTVAPMTELVNVASHPVLRRVGRRLVLSSNTVQVAPSCASEAVALSASPGAGTSVCATMLVLLRS